MLAPRTFAMGMGSSSLSFVIRGGRRTRRYNFALDHFSRRQPFKRLPYGRALAGFDILSSPRVKRCERFVGAREHGDRSTISIELACRQRPDGDAIRHRVEIGARTATTEAHRCVSVIERLGHHSAGGTPHSERGSLINASDRFAENKPLPRVSEEEDHFGIER